MDVGRREDRFLDKISEQGKLIRFLTAENTALELRLATGSRRIDFLEASYPGMRPIAIELRRAFGIDNE